MTCSKSDENIGQIVKILKEGKVVIIPTDTVYGFSGIVNLKNNPAFNTDGNIRKIKGRDEKKPLIQLIAKPEDIYLYTDVKIPENIFKLWPGPLTVIVPVKEDSPLAENCATVAFRCPGDLWLRKIIEQCGAPLYSTSVNRSGSPVLETSAEIKNEFEKEVAAIIDDGDKKGSLPSTLILLEKEGFKVLRQGSVIVEN
ncbi:MAG: L-threonylcarbamoyladenylate synthase [Treponema sp.]|nr:L-threonylcarbamoyladenylate synthase [Treponema sp.]